CLRHRSYALSCAVSCFLYFFNATATTLIYTLSLHDALPICNPDAEAPALQNVYRDIQRTLCHEVRDDAHWHACTRVVYVPRCQRSEEHTSELQSRENLVCRLLLEKKKKNTKQTYYSA